MEPSSLTPDLSPDVALLDELRRRRAELRDSMSALERALAEPAPRDQQRWAERVNVALVELSADFGAHVDITEGPDGLYAELARTAPRLSDPVARLTREHAVIREQIDRLLDCLHEDGTQESADQARDLATMLLGTLIRHRQRGSDLVYEAYVVDIGGGD